MKDLVKAFDSLPYLLKLIFCLPGLDIIWSVYRICKSASKSNLVGVILGILTIPCACVFWWIIDLVTLVLNHGKTIWWVC